MSEPVKEKLLKFRRIILLLTVVLVLMFVYKHDFYGLMIVAGAWVLGAIYSAIAVLLDDSLKDELEV